MEKSVILLFSLTVDRTIKTARECCRVLDAHILEKVCTLGKRYKTGADGQAMNLERKLQEMQVC